jgi:hypothetical protein
MARPLPRRKEDDVDLLAIGRASVARAKDAGGGDDSAQAMFVDGGIEISGAGAPFDFDERDHIAAPGNDVDFTAAYFLPLCKDAPAFEAEIPAGERFASPSAGFGFRPVHALPVSASARA